MKKKMVILSMAAVMAVTAAGCGAADTDKSNIEETDATTIEMTEDMAAAEEDATQETTVSTEEIEAILAANAIAETDYAAAETEESAEDTMVSSAVADTTATITASQMSTKTSSSSVPKGYKNAKKAGRYAVKLNKINSTGNVYSVTKYIWQNKNGSISYRIKLINKSKKKVYYNYCELSLNQRDVLHSSVLTGAYYYENFDKIVVKAKSSKMITITIPAKYVSNKHMDPRLGCVFKVNLPKRY